MSNATPQLASRALARLAPLGALVALAAVACNPTAAEGLFEAERFVYGNCEEDVLPWEPGFYTLNSFNATDTVQIRLQDIGGAVDLVDGVFIQLNEEFVYDNIGQPVLLGLPDESGEVQVRAIMGFYSTCPNTAVTPEMIGTITFQRFQPYEDGQISAKINAPTIVDARTGDILGINLKGEFSFVVTKGRPYTNFTGPGNEQ